MSEYIRKIINYLSKGVKGYGLGTRGDLFNLYALTKEEYEELLNYEISLIKKIKNRYYNTTDLDYSGSYDFQFVLTDVNKGKGTNSEFYAIMVYFDILPGGTVPLNGVYTDIDMNLITDHEWGWEVEIEIKDIFRELITKSNQFLMNSKTWEVMEIYINYPE